MLRRQFMQLLTDLRDELSISSDPAVGSAATANLKRVLSRTYETLYDAHDWSHLRRMFDQIPLNAGERYYDFPEDTDFDKLEKVVNWWGGLPHPVTRGIDFTEFAAFNSENDVRADPVTRWDVRNIDGKEMIEVWPIPSGSGQALQMKGKIKFKRLVDDKDLCLLDDQVVVLYAAAELAPPKKRTDANAKLNAALARLGVIKARGSAGSPSVRMGLSQDHARHFRGITVRVSR